jgi:integrase
MFNELFFRSHALTRQLSAPLVEERRQYLAECASQGMSRRSLRAGVDINTIRAWLGHVSLNTTNVYAEVDLEMKAKALATCEVHGSSPSRHWKKDAALMQFLQSL